MKKPKEKQLRRLLSGRRVAAIAGILIVLIAGLYIFRGWVRVTIIPRSIQLVHGNSAHKAFDDEMKKLDDPLAQLGYTSLQSQRNECGMVLADGFSTQVSCIYEVQTYSEITKASHSKDELNANAAKLQNLLQQNGWQGEYSNDGTYTSLVKLVSSLTAGIDYQPDATYQKQVGPITCFFSSNTAFASPNPPAIATQISCQRTFNILGTPSY